MVKGTLIVHIENIGIDAIVDLITTKLLAYDRSLDIPASVLSTLCDR